MRVRLSTALAAGASALVLSALPITTASAAPQPLLQSSTGLVAAVPLPAQLPAEGGYITTPAKETYKFTVGMRECGLITTDVSGSCVASLQRMLNYFLPASLTVDAVAGPETVEAIRRYQQTRGLAVNGIVGDAERAALMSDYKAAWAFLHPPYDGGYAYTQVYNLSSGSATYAHAEAINAYVVSHFRSTFPVAGDCPDEIYVGLQCDLIGYGKGKIQVMEIGYRHFSILSLPGHAEGAGRRINFTFTVDGSTTQMVVNAEGPAAGLTGTPILGRLNGSLFVPFLWEDLARRVTNLSAYGIIE